MISVKHSVKKRFLLIEFKKNENEPSMYIDFDLYKQRFYKTPEMFATVLEYTFNANHKLYMSYMKIKNLIMTYEVDEEKFKKTVFDYLLTDDIKNIAEQYLQDNYEKFEKIKENESNEANDDKNQLIITENQIKDLL